MGVLYVLGGAAIIAGGCFLQLWIDHLHQKAWEARFRNTIARAQQGDAEAVELALSFNDRD